MCSCVAFNALGGGLRASVTGRLRPVNPHERGSRNQVCLRATNTVVIETELRAGTCVTRTAVKTVCSFMHADCRIVPQRTSKLVVKAPRMELMTSGQANKKTVSMLRRLVLGHTQCATRALRLITGKPSWMKKRIASENRRQ